MTSLPDPSADSCPNCGQPDMAAYCPQCGEKRRDRADWKLSSIAGETFAELTNLEHSKLWQTLWLLVFKPGQLTREYWSGRRKRFLGPVKLYIVFFALYLVLDSLHQPTSGLNLRTMVAAKPAGGFSRFVDQMANNREMPMSQFAQEVNARWRSYFSWSQAVYPLFVALALKLLLRRRGLYFAEHLIFALHWLAFVNLSGVLLWPLNVLLGIQPSNEHFTAALLTAGSMTWTALYLLLALRRAYAERWLPALCKSALVFVTYGVTTIFFLFAALALAISLTRGGG